MKRIISLIRSIVILAAAIIIGIIAYFYAHTFWNRYSSRRTANEKIRHPPPPPIATYTGGKSYKDLYFLPKRAYLSHVEGAGSRIEDSTDAFSYGTDYSTLAFLFAPDYYQGHILPMLDIRGHRFNNGEYAANIGLAARYIPSSFCTLLGINLFYDYREGFKESYHQIGAGLEALGKSWDFRANVYTPIGVQKRKTVCHFDDYIGDYVITRRESEGINVGFNMEVGFLGVQTSNFILYAALGPYYFANSGERAIKGGKFRMRPQYKDYLALDLSITYDNVYRTVFQAEIVLSFPLYELFTNKNKTPPCGVTERQIYQPIIRYEVTPVNRQCCWETSF